MLKPCNLNPEDKVAARSLSWSGPSVFARRYQNGIQQWQRELGLPVVEMPNILKAASWLARNPKARADDLMQAFADPFIKGIFATLGGDDSIRLLALMDLNVIRDNPKIFMGYSDTTISHLMGYKAGLASFFGPSLLVEFADYDHAFLYVVRDEEGLNHLPLITHMDFGLTGPMFVLPYGLQAEIDCDQQRFSMIENAAVD